MDEIDEVWVLPSAIPFDTLKGRDLEECVYWLIDSLGAKDLEWRLGGTGGGAADGGRDLEAWFYRPSPDGDMEGQRWWVECKGRSGTVESEAVKQGCNNALAQSGLEYLVIATNTTFSNPTRDWVKAWQVTHPRPIVKLWDSASLERMLSKHPNAVFRLFAEALSNAGQLEVAREGFWNRFSLSTPKMLKTFWDEREELVIGPMERTALIVSEFASGRIDHRPWGVACDPRETFSTLGLVMANLPYLFGRALRSGIEQEPLIRSIAYIILSSLMSFRSEDVAELIESQLTNKKDEPFPKKFVDLLMDPILNTLVGEVGDVCSSDCARFTLNEPRILVSSRDLIEEYWWRLKPEGRNEEETDGRYLRIEATKEPCKVGFQLDQENSCPLFDDSLSNDDLRGTLAVVEKVAEFRLAELTRPKGGD